MIKVEITDGGVVEAFNRLIALGENPQGALMGIGEVMQQFTRERFIQSEDPYGEAWAPNADATLRAALHGGSRNFTKKGALSKKGASFLANKKPLIGDSRSLSTQFASTVLGSDTVTLTSLMGYAAIHNFGGQAGRGHKVTIPARQIFPDEQRGLPQRLQDEISGVLRSALEGAWNG